MGIVGKILINFDHFERRAELVSQSVVDGMETLGSSMRLNPNICR